MLNKNDVVTLEITALTNEGSGVGHYGADENSRGMAVFVPFTAVGDVISCRIVKVLKSYAYGRLEAILTASPDRVENYCPVYGKCGGCCFRHISYEAELRAKEGFVREAFGRIGGLSPEMLPICGSESVDGYRNKLQMPLSRQDGRTVCGFFSERSHRVIPTEKCALQPEIFAEIANFVTEQADRLRISVYNEEKHEGVLRHVYLRRGHYSGEICLCLVARRKVPEFQKLAKSVTERFPQITSLYYVVNTKLNDSISDLQHTLYRGREHILERMEGLLFRVGPKSFYQTNSEQAYELYKVARGFAALTGTETLYDLYTGTGTIANFCAAAARSVIGVEYIPEAIEDARLNSEANGITNTRFYAGDMKDVLNDDFIARNGHPDVMILDPPRAGVDPRVIEVILRAAPERIVYVSCNPATQARDLSLLDAAYRVTAVQPVDMFPHTHHVENVVRLDRR